MGWSSDEIVKTRDPMSEQMWNDKDPSLVTLLVGTFDFAKPLVEFL
jgi:hypothetical protein